MDFPTNRFWCSAEIKPVNIIWFWCMVLWLTGLDSSGEITCWKLRIHALTAKWCSSGSIRQFRGGTHFFFGQELRGVWSSPNKWSSWPAMSMCESMPESVSQSSPESLPQLVPESTPVPMFAPLPEPYSMTVFAFLSEPRGLGPELGKSFVWCRTFEGVLSDVPLLPMPHACYNLWHCGVTFRVQGVVQHFWTLVPRLSCGVMWTPWAASMGPNDRWLTVHLLI